LSHEMGLEAFGKGARVRPTEQWNARPLRIRSFRKQQYARLHGTKS
jgi:hypothetical protein